LRSNAVADGKQKHEEGESLQRLRNGDSELSDDDTGQEGSGDGSETKTAKCELPEIVSESKCKKDGDLRILPERCCEPTKHRQSPQFWPAPHRYPEQEAGSPLETKSRPSGVTAAFAVMIRTTEKSNNWQTCQAGNENADSEGSSFGTI